jgi:RNA polymerase sigma factor (sigma-70 family)
MAVVNARLQKYQYILDLDLRCYIRSAYGRIAKDKKRERAYLTIIPKPCSQKRDYKNHYFGDVSGFTLLNAKEEYELFDRYNYLKYRIICLQKEFRRNNKTQALKSAEQYYNNYIKVKHILAESNLRLVVKIANSKTYNQDQLQDAISDYNLVLLRCIDRFDHRRGFKFSTYMSSALINESRGRRKNTIYTESSDYLEELAVYKPDCTLDIEKYDDLGVVKTLLSNLEGRDYDIICKRFGLNGHPRMTLRAIAEVYNITKERIRQIERRILSQMRLDVSG